MDKLFFRGEYSMTQLKPNSYPPELTSKAAGISTYGVSNADDLIYLFPVLTGLFRPLNAQDLVFSSRFMKLLATFAT